MSAGEPQQLLVKEVLEDGAARPLLTPVLEDVVSKPQAMILSATSQLSR